jgi:hypothetical protein
LTKGLWSFTMGGDDNRGRKYQGMERAIP